MNLTQVVAQAFAPEHAHSAAADRLMKVVSWGTRLLILLVPLTFLPWTFEIFEFNKQLVLLVLGFLILVVWMASGVVAREARQTKSVIGWGVAAFLLAVATATVFSVDPVTSFLGFYGRFNGGFISTLSYAVLFFAVLQSARTSEDGRWLMGSWLTGLGLGALVLLLQLLGLRWLPFPAGGLSSFTPLGGSLTAVSLALAASVPLGLYLSRLAKQSVGRWGALAFVALALVLLFSVDYNLGWLALAVGGVAWLCLVFWKNEGVGFQWTVVPSIAILLAAVGWPLVTTNFSRLPIPVEVNLSQSASWKVAWQNVSSHALLGTGPETFLYGFSKYKPEGLNDSNFWAFRFDRATSQFAQLLSTTGFVGLAAYLAVIVLALWVAVRALLRREREDWYLDAALTSTLLVLVAGDALYFSTSLTATLMWLVLGLIAARTSMGERAYPLASSPRASLSFSFGLAVVVLVALGACFMAGRFFLADVAYAKAQAEARTLDTLDQSRADMVRAVTLNPWRDSYRIGLAQVLMALANKAANDPLAKDQAGQRQQLSQLQAYIASSIAAARSATELARENVANWEALGSIYRGTVLFARDAERWVISSFEQAIALEPSNPALFTELGKAHLISAQRTMAQAAQAKETDKLQLDAAVSEQLTKAMDQFNRALQLKPDYAPAKFQQALVFELQGKTSEAIQKLEDMRTVNPQDIDVLYELGTLYYNDGAYDKAEGVFTDITTLVPNHANAHFGLALVHQRTGATDKAIAELEQVLKLNPDNQQIQQALDDLRSGKAPVVPPPAAPAPPKQ